MERTDIGSAPSMRHELSTVRMLRTGMESASARGNTGALTDRVFVRCPSLGSSVRPFEMYVFVSHVVSVLKCHLLGYNIHNLHPVENTQFPTPVPSLFSPPKPSLSNTSVLCDSVI